MVNLLFFIHGRVSRGRTDIRIPTANIPSEIRPLVEAVNQALDRLERGFRYSGNLPPTRRMNCALRLPSFGRVLKRWRIPRCFMSCIMTSTP